MARPAAAGSARALLREFERWQLVGRQIAELETERTAKIREDKTPQVEQGAAAAEPQGDRRERRVAAGDEFFAWRQFRTAASWGAWRG